METLRTEIREAQQIRANFLKWKLVLVATLAGVGLGLWPTPTSSTSSKPLSSSLLLCLIPFVCIYVDVLCRHANLRILVIAKFLREANPDEPSTRQMRQYEKLCKEMREKESVFLLETWALVSSSLALDILVILVGTAIVLSTAIDPRAIDPGAIDPGAIVCTLSEKLDLWSQFVIGAFWASGVAGILSTIITEIIFKDRSDKIDKFELSRLGDRAEEARRKKSDPRKSRGE